MILFDQLSITGRYHKFRGEENQDVICHIQTERYGGIIAADGVSTCAEGKAGAALTCKTMKERVLSNAENIFRCNCKQTTKDLLNYNLFALDKTARASSRRVEDYASTFCMALFDTVTKKLMVMNLGDGIILARQNGECRVLAYPSGSCDGNCWVTTTKNAEQVTRADILDAEEIDAVIICTDGAWSLPEGAGLDPNVSAGIAGGNLEGLKHYLMSREPDDDCSFAAMLLEGNRRAE